jgi:hypothetical protein
MTYQQHQANLGSKGKHSMFGYKFGYRHQFGSFTQDCANRIILKHLRQPEIALDFPYLS